MGVWTPLAAQSEPDAETEPLPMVRLDPDGGRGEILVGDGTAVSWLRRHPEVRVASFHPHDGVMKVAGGVARTVRLGTRLTPIANHGDGVGVMRRVVSNRRAGVSTAICRNGWMLESDECDQATVSALAMAF